MGNSWGLEAEKKEQEVIVLVVVDVEVDGGAEHEGPVVACPCGEGDGRLVVFLWTGS